MNGNVKPFDALANLGFLVLFPGFMVYHFAVSVGIIPPFLGGLFGPACAAFAVVALVHLATQLRSSRADLPLLHWAFVLFCAFFLLWVLVAGVLNPHRLTALAAVTECLGTLIIWLAVFFVGSRMNLHAPAMRRAVGVSALVLVGLFVFAFVSEGSFLGPFILFKGGDETGGTESGAATYQAVGRSILCMGIVVAAFQRRFSRQAMVLGLTIGGLLCLGSRAHLFSSVLCILALTVVVGFRRGQRVAAATFIGVAAAISIAAAGLFLKTRASEILDLATSSSWQARLELQHRAMRVIAENPLTGDFGYHHWGTFAGYAHNILSAWAGFGIVTFLAYLGLMLYALKLSAERVLGKAPVDPYWLIAFQTNIVALMMALASEPIFASVFPALGWGVTVNALRQERNRKVAARQARDLAASCAAQEARWSQGHPAIT
jgi:hypothetical protein